MRTRWLFLLLVLVPTMASAITPSQLVKQARTTAAESLNTAVAAQTRLGKLIETYPDQQFGVQVQRSASTPAFLPIFEVPLDQLRGFNVDDAAIEIVLPTPRVYWQVFYPLVANTQYLSSIEVEQTTLPDDGWEMTRMGGASYADAVWQTLDRAGWPPEPILVQVPALALHFVGFVKGEKLMLSLIAMAPGIDLPVRKPRDAKHALEKLVKLAQHHNGKNN